MKKVRCFIMICLLLPGCALAETRRGDWGEEVYEIQQLLFDTGFLFEEPDGSEHIEYCGRHAMIAESADLANLTGAQPETLVCQQWEDAIKVLYDEWMRASEEEEQPMIASSQATFLFWINQQRMTLIMQGDENVESKLEPVLRSQCVELCAIVHGSQE